MRVAAASVESHRAMKPATYHRPTRMGLCIRGTLRRRVRGGLCVSLTRELRGSGANRLRFVTPQANRSNELAKGITGCDHETTPFPGLRRAARYRSRRRPELQVSISAGVAMHALGARPPRSRSGASNRAWSSSLRPRTMRFRGATSSKDFQNPTAIPFPGALRDSRRAVERSALSPRPQVPSWSNAFAPGPQPAFRRLRDLAPQKANPVASA